MHKNETPYLICIKFGRVQVSPTITNAKFGYDQLRGFWVAGVKFSPSHGILLAPLQHSHVSVACLERLSGVHLKMKCLPVLLYGLESCPLNKSQTKSLDFAINSVLEKCDTKSKEIIDNFRIYIQL